MEIGGNVTMSTALKKLSYPYITRNPEIAGGHRLLKGQELPYVVLQGITRWVWV